MNSSQQSLLNQQLMEKKQALQRQMMEQKQLLLQQQMLAEAEKITPQDQLNRHLTRPPPDYKDQRRNVVNMQQANQYPGGSPAVSMSSNNMSLSNPISTHSIMPQSSSLMSTPAGTRMPSVPAARSLGCYGNLPCNQPSTYNQGDSIGPALNSDSDFIDSLLKTEPGNDDWMKDINLDEILGNHSKKIYWGKDHSREQFAATFLEG
ncbi:hypothetical protein EK904_000124 [Melospiza melodia maxima]|nr:hypothetical protein EK904_000124 [Melospiza melodia maxima]